MDRDDEHSAHTDHRYASLDDSVIPDAENLKVTLERALPFWEDKIAPALKDGKNVFVGAHGNSIRALVKHIKQLSDDEIMDVEIPNFPPSPETEMTFVLGRTKAAEMAHGRATPKVCIPFEKSK